MKHLRLGAVWLYAYDTNALPGSLSELRPEDLERAYAMSIQGRRPHTLGMGIAEAATSLPPLPPKYYNNDLKVISCPSDPDSPVRGGKVSYQINKVFATESLSTPCWRPTPMPF